MALPLNIEELVHGKTIEWERLEFKKGWNPEVIVRSMCAFANDLNNWGGGYIIVGVNEDDGQPILPPEGLPQDELDRIQKKIVELGNRIIPSYFPIVQPYYLNGKHILVLWCPAGDNRPYSAPDSLGKEGGRLNSYVRLGAASVIAKGDTLRRLQELTARIPFDDRMNNQATIEDFNLGLIREYLQEVKSDLFKESDRMPLMDLCRAMYIVKGPIERVRPVNVGLLFFSLVPERFFPRSWIELVVHKDDSGSEFKEFYFKGPLHKQISETLTFLRTNVLAERVVKYPDRAEADRFYNFPYRALEEVLSNAVYHKSYELGSPIEVQVFPDKITVLSYPGPMPPVDGKVLKTEQHIFAREYRNRRIGDFLKELHLTEGRGTGFPIIYKAMEDNGSPAPVFETDDKTYTLVTLKVHPLYKESVDGKLVIASESDQADDQDNELIVNSISDIQFLLSHWDDQANDQAGDQVQTVLDKSIHEKVGVILSQLDVPKSRSEIFGAIGLKNHTDTRKRYLDPLLQLGWVRMTIPEFPSSPNQKYIITESGLRLLNLISTK